jgi:hypothetical protein
VEDGAIQENAIDEREEENWGGENRDPFEGLVTSFEDLVASAE